MTITTTDINKLEPQKQGSVNGVALNNKYSWHRMQQLLRKQYFMDKCQLLEIGN